MSWLVSGQPHQRNRRHGWKANTREDAMLVLTRRIGERIVIEGVTKLNGALTAG